MIADSVAGVRALQAAPAAIRLVGADTVCSAAYGLLTVTLVLVGRKIDRRDRPRLAGGGAARALFGLTGAMMIAGTSVLVIGALLLRRLTPGLLRRA